MKLAVGCAFAVAVVVGVAVAAELPHFEDVSRAALVRRVTQSYAQAWTDVNGDGWPDLMVVNHGTQPPALFVNQRDGTFRDAIHTSGITLIDDHHGVTFGDYDRDGDLDLYFSIGAVHGRGEGANYLYRNEGNLTFTDVTADAGLADPEGRGRSAAWMDYDRDGWPDLFVAQWARANAPDHLFHNKGDGTFVDVAPSVGLADNGPTEAGLWADADQDGWPDLLVVSAKHCKLYRNDHGKRFVEVQRWEAGPAAWGDYDNDGDPDLFLGDYPQTQIKGIDIPGLAAVWPASNRLLRNDGHGQFTDVASVVGLAGTAHAVDSAGWVDIDNDGLLDLYGVRSGTHWGNFPNLLFHQTTDGKFEEVAGRLGVAGPKEGVGCGGIWADFNHDGQQDLFLTNGRGKGIWGPYVLLRGKPTGAHWLDVVPVEHDGTYAVGAQVWLVRESSRSWRQADYGQRGLSADAPWLHFGLGAQASVPAVEVLWLDGTGERFTLAGLDRTVTLERGHGENAVIGRAP